jgi:hypothetical protein
LALPGDKAQPESREPDRIAIFVALELVLARIGLRDPTDLFGSMGDLADDVFFAEQLALIDLVLSSPGAGVWVAPRLDVLLKMKELRTRYGLFF